VNKFYRFSGTAVAAVTLAAAAAAFGAQYAAAQPAAHLAPAAAAIASPAPHPMIPAALPAGAAAFNAVSNTSNFHTVGSQNWAGYAVTGPKFRQISATFFVPFMNCAVTSGSVTPGDFSSHWVGLDGFSSQTVEQDGVEADCINGTAQYVAWREVFPRPEQPSTMKIKPGDSITASVRFNPLTSKYRMEVMDNTNGHHFTVWQACAGSACKRSSAEIISEAPTVNGDQASLADYGAEGFSGISITNGSERTGGIKSSHWTGVRIEQVGFSTRNIIAHPTAVSGTSFANYWLGEN